MNFAVSFRQAWFGPISKIPFLWVPLIGLDPTIVAVAGSISTLWGIVGHTQIINKLGPLEIFLNTPSHHRVHHMQISNTLIKIIQLTNHLGQNVWYIRT